MAAIHILAYVSFTTSFTIYQDAEPSEFWTGYFAVTPSRAGVKGEPRMMPSGQPSMASRYVERIQ